MAARGLVKEGPAPQEWEGFSFSNITLRNFTLPKKQKLTFWVSPLFYDELPGQAGNDIKS